MNKLTKAEIVSRLRSRIDAPVQVLEEAVSGTLDVISDTLASGGRVELRGFGVFRVRVVASRIGRNPKRPEKSIPIKREARVRFRAGSPLQKRVAKLTKTLDTASTE